MPAVSIEQLQNHLELLRSAFNSPQIFVSELKDVLELYSDRTFRRGEKSEQDVRVPRYYIPILLQKQLELEFQRLAEIRLKNAIDNASLLWKEKYYEPKLLAACILGALPVQAHSETLTILNHWLNSRLEIDFLSEILERAGRSLRSNNSSAWFQQIQDWQKQDSTRLKARAILALRITAEDEHFTDLPMLLHQAETLFNNPPGTLIPDLLGLYQLLVRRFPDEMVVYTRELMADLRDANKTRFLRKAITFFDEPTVINLRRQFPPIRLT